MGACSSRDTITYKDGFINVLLKISTCQYGCMGVFDWLSASVHTANIQDWKTTTIKVNEQHSVKLLFTLLRPEIILQHLLTCTSKLATIHKYQIEHMQGSRVWYCYWHEAELISDDTPGFEHRSFKTYFSNVSSGFTSLPSFLSFSTKALFYSFPHFSFSAPLNSRSPPGSRITRVTEEDCLVTNILQPDAGSNKSNGVCVHLR